MSEQVPSIGSIVHYQTLAPAGRLSLTRAAIVTANLQPLDILGVSERMANLLGPATISLCVLSPTGILLEGEVPFSATPEPGHWSWPPRQDVEPRIAVRLPPTASEYDPNNTGDRLARIAMQVFDAAQILLDVTEDLLEEIDADETSD